MSSAPSASRRHCARRALLIAAALAPASSWAQGEPITFSVAGDYPYAPGELQYLQEHVDLHNLYSPSDFFVHVGDIKSGTESCAEQRYIDVAEAVRELAVPAFVLVGDNEWMDCSNPGQGWSWYQEHLSDLDQYFCYPWELERQAVRNENWAFVYKGVLFAGINIPNGSEGNAGARLQQDADWVSFQMTDKKSVVRAAVIFGHAGLGGNRDTFFSQFESASGSFGKPVLYIMGDEHHWTYDNPFSKSNMKRIILNRGNVEQPVQITVTTSPSSPWSIVRDPWDGNPSIFDHEPCVDVGDDETVAVSDVLPINAFVQDDGSTTVLWTKESGPGTVTFGNSRRAATTATFGEPGIYELRCTVDDGPHEVYDELVVTVTGSTDEIYLAIGDVSLNEGNSGTVTAAFQVVRSGTGTGSFSVNYATADSTAHAGSDYTQTSGTLSFTSSTFTRTVSVPVLGDTTLEPDEIFFVNLSGATGGVIVTKSKGRGTILNDDGSLPNQDPSAAPDSFAVAEDHPLVVEAPGVLDNDSDPEGQPLTAAVVSLPAHGTLGLSSDGSFTYTPSSNYFGPDGFLYRAADGFGGLDTAAVAIDVEPVNDAPVTIADFYETGFNASLLVPLPGVLANDTDVDDESLFALLLTDPSHGVLALAADGSFTFDPDPGFFGVDSFTYRATDGTAPGNSSVVRIGVGTRRETTYLPTEDTYIAVSSSTTSYGASPELRYRGGGNSYRTYVKYEPVGAGAALSARLRFRVTSTGTPGVCNVTANTYSGTGTPWREENLNNGNAPRPGAEVAPFDTPPTGDWIEIDASSVVVGDGVYSFTLSGNTGNTATLSSKEGPEPPQLVIDAYHPENAPDIAAIPSAHDYGDVVVGEAATQRIQIVNGGLLDLHVTSVALGGADAAEFAIDAGGGAFTIAPGDSHSIDVGFEPSSLGTKLAHLDLASDDPDEGFFSVPLQGTGVGAPTPDIAVTPASFDFGDVYEGSSAAATFTVRNEGTFDLAVSGVSVVGADAADFAITAGGGSFVLAPGASSSVEVAFQPASEGTRSAALRIASDDPDESPLDVPLAGRGVALPTGGGEVAFDVAVSGGSSGGITVSSDPVPGASPAAPTDLYLVAVTSKPHVPVAAVDGLGLAWTLVREQCGARGQTGISLFRAMGPSAGGVVTATFEGAPGAAAIAVSRFTGVNASSPLGTVVRGNTLGVDGPCDGGTDGTAYSLPIATTAPGSMIASCVALRRRSHEPGAGYIERLDFYEGSGGTSAGLAVMDRGVDQPSALVVNGTFDGTVDWALVAVEVLPGSVTPVADVSVVPASHDYGSVAPGEGASHTFAVHNSGGASLAVTGTSITGADAAEFQIDAGGGAFTLAPGEAHDVTVSFRPLSTGAKSALLRVTSDDPDEPVVDVPLAGTGFEPPPPGGVEIALEGVFTGGSTASVQVATSGTVDAGAGDLYLAAITSKKFVPALGVSGLGLAWSPVAAQCGARGQTGVEIWTAQGTPTGSGPVTVTLAEAPDNAALVVMRYSGVAAVGGVASANTNGEDGSCSGGVDTGAYSFDHATTVADAFVFAAIASRTKSHEPGSGWTEHADFQQGSSGATAGVAVMDRQVAVPGAVAVDGAFSGTVDWAVAAIELLPGLPAAAFSGGPRPGAVAAARPASARPVGTPDGVRIDARPNPFRDDVTIEYSLPATGPVEIVIYDVSGRRTRRLVSGVEAAGVRQVHWDGRDESRRRVASGVYFVKMQTGSAIRLHRLFLAR